MCVRLYDWDWKNGVCLCVHRPVETSSLVLLNPVLHTQQSVFKKHRKSERQSETEWRRTNGERISCLLLGFTPLLSALSSLEESGMLCQWVTDTQIHRAGDAGAIYHDLMPVLPSSLLARQLWHSQSKSRSPNTSNMRLGSSVWDTSREGFPSGVWQFGVYMPVIIPLCLLCLRQYPSIWPSTICYIQIDVSTNCSCPSVQVFPFKMFFRSLTTWLLLICAYLIRMKDEFPWNKFLSYH